MDKTDWLTLVFLMMLIAAVFLAGLVFGTGNCNCVVVEKPFILG